MLLSDICCNRRSTAIAYGKIVSYWFENEAPRPSSTSFQMFYLVMISCNVSEKSYEEQIIPSEGWDLDTNIQNHFPICFLSRCPGNRARKGLLLLLRCSERGFDKRSRTLLKLFKFSPNVLLLHISLEAYRKFREGLEPMFLVALKDGLITASN